MATKISRILITGSHGFIGSHLYEALTKRGYEVEGYDLKDGYDINDSYQLSETFRIFKPHFVFHLAAVSSRQLTDRDPQLALQTNIIGTFNVLSFCKRYRVRSIIASSAATKEPSLSLYGTSKDCMETISRMFEDSTIVRFYNVYGPGGKGVINKFIRRIKADTSIKLNGNTARDYIYVSDVVGGLIEIMEYRWGGKVYELGTGRSTKLKALVRLIEKLIGKDAMVEYGKPIKEIQESQMDEKYRFFKPISLREGIRRLI